MLHKKQNKMTKKTNIRVIISGGGTGGHVFPAIAIANAIKEQSPDAELLFVGAKGKIEMQAVPNAGYKIEALPIQGFLRKISFHNVKLIFNLIKSLLLSNKIIKKFKPDIVVGVGGYASGAIVYVAQKKGIPTLIQEQNSYAGVTNKILSRKAKKICVAYDNMEKFFDSKKIVKTGNPVRKYLYNNNVDKNKALDFFKLSKNKTTILVLGGSGGARSVNQAVIGGLETIKSNPNIQFIWQTGKYYYEKSFEELKKHNTDNVQIFAFIKKMDFAFAVADIVISRAGAGTISELCLVKKPAILVPSPNVAEDHQTKNAMALTKENAAILVKDVDAEKLLIKETIKLSENKEKLLSLTKNISKLAIYDSDKLIVNEIFKLKTND